MTKIKTFFNHANYAVMGQMKMNSKPKSSNNYQPGFVLGYARLSSLSQYVQHYFERDDNVQNHTL